MSETPTSSETPEATPQAPATNQAASSPAPPARSAPGRAAMVGPEPAAAEPTKPAELPKLWYVIHTQTGQELKVKDSLDSKIQQGLVHGQIAHVLVPTERVAEVRGGKKRISERKFFPGYLLVEMALTDESWHLVRTTPGVTGFIGAGRRPLPLSEDEVGEILRQTAERKDKPIPRVTFQKGEGVRVAEGHFGNFSGVIEEVNPARGKLKVLISIFGRQTPVELEFWQVERL